MPPDEQKKQSKGETPDKMPDVEALTTELLRGKSQNELIAIIMALKAKLPQSTDQLVPSLAQISFDARVETEVAEYTRLPLVTVHTHEDPAKTTWKLKLISSDTSYKPMGLAVYDDVIVGRTTPTSKPDLDLDVFNAERLGVSRQHALMRPTQSSLFLIDLDSTNGTYRNGLKLGVGVAQKLYDNDTISFAHLHLMIKIVEEPPTAK